MQKHKIQIDTDQIKNFKITYDLDTRPEYYNKMDLSEIKSHIKHNLMMELFEQLKEHIIISEIHEVDITHYVGTIQIFNPPIEPVRITAKMIRDFRERWSCGIQESMLVLQEANGDLECASNLLRTRGW
jgi:hypothetical protein